MPARVSDLAAVTSPPYDVIDPDDATHLEQLDPHNVVRLILPRDPRGGAAGVGPGRYAHAAELLDGWRADGILRRDPRPALYVYEQSGPGVFQRGLLAAVGLHDPADRVVLPHEDVMPGPVADRLELMRATGANLEPILLVYDGGGDTAAVLDEVAAGPPTLETTTEDGLTQRVWAVDGPRAARAGGPRPGAAAGADRRRPPPVGDLPAAAGGAARGRAGRRPVGPRAGDAGRLPHLAAAGGGDPPGGRRPRPGRRAGRRRRDLHRRAGRGRPRRRPWRRWRETAGAHPFVRHRRRDVPPARPTRTRPRSRRPCRPSGRPGGGRWTPACCTCCCSSGSGRSPTTLAGSATCTTARSAVRAARRAHGVAVLMRPVAVSDVLALAAEGERMPRKSTSFGPKPRTGLVLRLLDD